MPTKSEKNAKYIQRWREKNPDYNKNYHRIHKEAQKKVAEKRKAKNDARMKAFKLTHGCAYCGYKKRHDTLALCKQVEHGSKRTYIRLDVSLRALSDEKFLGRMADEFELVCQNCLLGEEIDRDSD